MNNNIILIGFMGSGKTSVGQRLAEKLGYKFIDMDDEIEKKEERSVHEIFSESGEEYFRQAETNYLKTLELKDKTVLATGGGVVLKEENTQLLKEKGTVLFLHADVDQIMSNVKDDTTRPLLKGENKVFTITKLLEEREGIYLSAADVIIQTSGKTVDHIIDEIISLLY